MCTHFRSYLRGAQFTLRTDHSSLRWLQKFCNGDEMLARWYMLLGQFSVTFEYRPGAQHANADGMSRQCGQCMRPGCPADLPPAGSDMDLIVASRQDATLTTVREWGQSGAAPAWSACLGLSPELRCLRLQIGNLSVDTEGDCGVAGLLRQGPLSSLYQVVSIRI